MKKVNPKEVAQKVAKMLEKAGIEYVDFNIQNTTTFLKTGGIEKTSCWNWEVRVYDADNSTVVSAYGSNVLLMFNKLEEQIIMKKSISTEEAVEIDDDGPGSGTIDEII